MPTIDIPDYWSTEQALAIYEFLDEIQQRIWDYYGPDLTEMLSSERCANIDPSARIDEFDDEIPF